MEYKRAYKKRNFTKSEQANLIKFVQQNEVLFNSSHKDYRSSQIKDELWLQFALRHNKTIDDVKQRWKNIKDYELKKIRRPPLKKRRTDDDETVEPNEIYDYSENEQADSRLDFFRSYVTENPPKTSNRTSYPGNFLQIIVHDSNGTGKVDNDSSAEFQDLSCNSPTAPQCDINSNGSNNPSNAPADVGQSSSNFRSKRSHSSRAKLLLKEMRAARKERTEQTDVLKEIFLDGLFEQYKKTTMQAYFEAYAQSIQALPLRLQKECERKIRTACQNIIDEFENKADIKEEI